MNADEPGCRHLQGNIRIALMRMMMMNPVLSSATGLHCLQLVFGKKPVPAVKGRTWCGVRRFLTALGRTHAIHCTLRIAAAHHKGLLSFCTVREKNGPVRAEEQTKLQHFRHCACPVKALKIGAIQLCKAWWAGNSSFKERVFSHKL